ncbi:hypothetical protein [Vineibacter terrae]|uniref:hypothetical protein n=1 Tax=Vineibacter terrae TaxID=2586908 RepID=UPI002E31DF39|nr:hypothetical protein [Vineibacter terrae]HEX2888804.1 hypothetical protein [Vineibacter terrae]
MELAKGAGPMHQRVQNELLAQPVVCPPDILTAKSVFATMKRDRERADYDLNVTVTVLDAQVAVDRAKRVVLAIP